MEKDLFQLQCRLSFEDRMVIMETLKKLNIPHVHCSACESDVSLGFLRKRHDDPLEEAMCIPCFLHNYTDADQDDIDRMVELANEQGWYK